MNDPSRIAQRTYDPVQKQMGPGTRRVLHCIPNMLGGGAQRQLVYLAAEQVRRGWEVHVALVYGGPVFESLKASGAVIHQLVLTGNYDPRLLRYLIQLIRRVEPVAVQTWLTQMDVVGGVAARLTRTPWVLSERASTLAYPRTLKNRLREIVGRRADAIVSVSEGGNRYWTERACPRTLRRIVRNAIAHEEIAQFPPIARAAIGLEEGRKMVLYAGRLDPEKHIDVLIEALQEAERHLPMKAYFCGDGSLQSWARKKIDDEGLGEWIRLAGYVPDVWGWMKTADVFVSLGTTEGNPNAVLEAISCGCPVVLSESPEHREVANDDSALFVPFDSPIRVAEAIVRSLTEPSEARDRASKARDRLKRWTISDVADQHEEIYRIAASAKGLG